MGTEPSMTFAEMQAIDKLLDELLCEHAAHDSSYFESKCRACIHRAAFNYQHNIDKVEARTFLSGISIPVREAAIKDVNYAMGDQEYYVAPIQGKVL